MESIAGSDSAIGSMGDGSDVTFGQAAPGPTTDSSSAKSGTSSGMTFSSGRSFADRGTEQPGARARAELLALGYDYGITPQNQSLMDGGANPEGIVRSIEASLTLAVAEATRPL